MLLVSNKLTLNVMMIYESTHSAVELSSFDAVLSTSMHLK